MRLIQRLVYLALVVVVVVPVAFAATRPQPRIVNGVDTFDYPSVGALRR